MIDRVQSALGLRVTGERALGGGCIGDARWLTLENGRAVFAKSVTACPESLPAEALGLSELAKASDGPRVPQVLHAEPGLLILEALQTGAPTDAGWGHFGKAFARMHRTTREGFGFDEDNWIGATPQRNCVSDSAAADWATFYWEARLEPQFRSAEAAGHNPSALRSARRNLEPRIVTLLQGTEEPPSLLHGDLWSGNVLWDESGAAVIIDPAVYYGHREADLAMTCLFGGFPPSFYEAYESEWPLPAGWRSRVPLYELYHVLNHLNLFGGSYLAGVLDRCNRVTR